MTQKFSAPGHSEAPFEFPPCDPSPRIDDRIAPPETRVEYLHGGELYAMPAQLPHATKHHTLSYVLGAYVAPEYQVAIDMLTRTGPGSDFAPDASVFSTKEDPETGGRALEELAFEIASEQPMGVPTDKARELVRRGVRRVFCLVVKHNRLLEWSRAVDNWEALPSTTTIDDPCLVRPMPASALLEAASADNAVANALLAKENPVIMGAVAKGRAEGEARGEAALREAIVTLCEVLAVAIDDTRMRTLETMRLGELRELLRTIRSDRVWPRAP